MRRMCFVLCIVCAACGLSYECAACGLRRVWFASHVVSATCGLRRVCFASRVVYAACGLRCVVCVTCLFPHPFSKKQDSNIRVVQIGVTKGACVGTHVHKLSQIPAIVVGKPVKKAGRIRLPYSVTV